MGILLTILALLAAWALLVGVEPVNASKAFLGVLCVVPLGLAFLTGARRGAAHEASFNRIVLSCPITSAEWFLGRLIGVHLLSGLYLLLIGPFLLAYVLLTPAPPIALLRALLGYLGLVSAVHFLALLASAHAPRRGAAMQALLVMGLLLTLILPMNGAGDTEGTLPLFLRFFTIALSPLAQAVYAIGGYTHTTAPWPLALLTLAATATALGREAFARSRDGTLAPRARALTWLIPFALTLLLAATTEASPTSYGDHDDPRAWAIHGTALLLIPLAFLPLAFALRRWRHLRRAAAASSAG